MPTKKTTFRDMKPTKDAKGGGGHGGATQGGHGITQGGGGTRGTQNAGLQPPAGKNPGKIQDPLQSE